MVYLPRLHRALLKFRRPTTSDLRQQILCLAVCLFGSLSCAAVAAGIDLEAGFADPPPSARLRAYWWWLNGNVTEAAITRDLEEMKAKGFGGALICDAGGAEQDGNASVPHGPDFLSPEWRALYRHALKEAERLGLEMSLNIQSGWNLGGPTVTADDAAKKLVWSETRLPGPLKFNDRLPAPQSRDNYYRDQWVIAYRLEPAASTNENHAEVRASSSQEGHPAADAIDGKVDTFWVSDTTQPGQGPSRERPQWLELALPRLATIDRLALRGRPGYGPRDCALEVSDDGRNFRTLRTFAAPENGSCSLEFPPTTARVFRIRIFSAFDPRSAQAPRNVQVADLQLSGKDGAWPGSSQSRVPLQHWQQKAVHKALHFSAPDTKLLFEELPAEPNEEDTRTADVIDLTSRLGRDGKLHWDVPSGTWQVLRFGCTIGDHSQVSTSSDGWKGYALDVLDAGAFQRYWDAVVEPLIADAGPLAGKTLKYLHTDSWEVEAINWTPSLREEFRKRRGYDLLPFLPTVTGRIVDSRPVSNRFLQDFRKTLGDLAIDHHYRLFRDWAHKHGLLIHPESGGPHASPIDAQRCLGWDDAPMSEFWAWSWRHRIGDENRFFVKQPASAAHTYGHRLVLAEGFTTIGPHWQETLWDNLKPSFDKALCEGLNLLVWHAFVCSPQEMGIPGQQYFAGTHFNPNTTWWMKSGPFLRYLNRCQFLLQQGLFVADACYYYGDHVPNFSQLKKSDPARVLPGYDYDVITEEAILTRLSVRENRLVLPDGMSYRMLVLPQRAIISLPVLRKIKELVRAGATVIGPKPAEASGLQNFPPCDAEVAKLADALWPRATDGQRQSGKGRVIAGRTARQVLLADGIPPDFTCVTQDPKGDSDSSVIDYLHRIVDGADIYFVANRSNTWLETSCTFRVDGKAPEIWDAVTGQRRFATIYRQEAERTVLPLEFSPCGSWFVVFREPAQTHPPTGHRNQPHFEPRGQIEGAWTVEFAPKWGGPESAQFEKLESWTTRPEPGIRYYSGTATYRRSFELPAGLDGAQRLWLDLGELRELAEVRLNGYNLGVLWAPPFRVEISKAVKPRDNKLEIEVVNFWPNRIIGDQFLPGKERLTRTNIRKLTKETALIKSGLFGPVRLLEQVR